MAPTAPSRRRSLRAKLAARENVPNAPRRAPRHDALVPSDGFDSFATSKKDKRLIRHSSFVTKIRKSSAASLKTAAKRRRPSRKLVANLEALADALPEVHEDLQRDKTKHKSLRSKPGALKRKEMLMRGEMRRFGNNLALLQSVPEMQVPKTKMTADEEWEDAPDAEEMDVKEVTNETVPSTTNQWAALRGFISATMEQNPAFLGQGKATS